jgi:hypothetical protein
MKQIAYPAALGSCVLGGGATPLWAAEWSITPSYSASVDYESNRLLVEKAKGSDAAVLAVDLLFKRALEDLQFTFEPRYSWRRFTDAALGNGDDRTVNAGINWVRERSVLNLTASYWDQSTLTTELLETGIVSGNTHRRTEQAGVSWNWNQTERRSLIAQLSYMDVSYHGQNEALLPGFRYPSGSLGERFTFSERGSFTLSTYGTVLQSDTLGNSSHEVGLQAQIIYSFSERTNLNASIGESKRILGGGSSNGTDASVSFDHTLFLSKVSLGYTRALVPYGTGFLVQQQQITAVFSHPLSPFLDYNLTYLRVQNNNIAVLLRVDRPSYNSLSTGLNWHPAETWSVGARLEAVRTQLIGIGSAGPSVSGWNSSVTVTWSPFPKSRSW